ncbi:Rv3654c family TadE-like protein [Streptomyces sp. CA-132043]|uniref:Rv3654c family TadE-like protein n=1 Tax=Streptomyces sp. CA-132043 TaxID=3240048 RepID=UPI003D92FBF5
MLRRRWGGEPRGRRGDEGAATVCAAVSAMALCAVFAVVLTLGQATIARHRAGAAADLAALAAAGRSLYGEAEACDVARQVAAAQHARLVRCSVRAEIADVAAEARAGPFAPRIRSRAGPSDAPLNPVPPDASKGQGQGPGAPTGSGTATGPVGSTAALPPVPSTVPGVTGVAP